MQFLSAEVSEQFIISNALSGQDSESERTVSLQMLLDLTYFIIVLYHKQLSNLFNYKAI